jgi:hypothetical protein
VSSFWLRFARRVWEVELRDDLSHFLKFCGAWPEGRRAWSRIRHQRRQERQRRGDVLDVPPAEAELSCQQIQIDIGRKWRSSWPDTCPDSTAVVLFREWELDSKASRRTKDWSRFWRRLVAKIATPSYCSIFLQQVGNLNVGVTVVRVPLRSVCQIGRQLRRRTAQRLRARQL